jgi:hypothetical protein
VVEIDWDSDPMGAQTGKMKTLEEVVGLDDAGAVLILETLTPTLVVVQARVKQRKMSKILFVNRTHKLAFLFFNPETSL